MQERELLLSFFSFSFHVALRQREGKERRGWWVEGGGGWKAIQEARCRKASPSRCERDVSFLATTSLLTINLRCFARFLLPKTWGGGTIGESIYAQFYSSSSGLVDQPADDLFCVPQTLRDLRLCVEWRVCGLQNGAACATSTMLRTDAYLGVHHHRRQREGGARAQLVGVRHLPCLAEEQNLSPIEERHLGWRGGCVCVSPKP